jgi:hypothetical protein
MKKKNCTFEKKILQGLKAGSLAPVLKKHLSGCPVCEESAAIYNWMNNFREISLAESPKIAEKKLPTAETLWAGARQAVVPETELVKKALRPLLYMRMFSYAVVMIVPLFFILFYMPELKELINANPGANSIIHSLSTILKLLLESFSFLLLPMVVCVFTLVIFIFVTGFQPKKT